MSVFNNKPFPLLAAVYLTTIYLDIPGIADADSVANTSTIRYVSLCVHVCIYFMLYMKWQLRLLHVFLYFFLYSVTALRVQYY